jgi:hypothetical protein
LEACEERILTFGSSEVYHVAIFLEHIDLFNGLDRLNVQLLEGCLQFLVVGSGGLVDLFGFSPGCAFPSGSMLVSQLDRKSGVCTHPMQMLAWGSCFSSTLGTGEGISPTYQFCSVQLELAASSTSRDP